MEVKIVSKIKTISQSSLIFFGLMAILSHTVHSALARNVPVMVVQPDRTVLECYASRDEVNGKVDDMRLLIRRIIMRFLAKHKEKQGEDSKLT